MSTVAWYVLCGTTWVLPSESWKVIVPSSNMVCLSLSEIDFLSASERSDTLRAPYVSAPSVFRYLVPAAPVSTAVSLTAGSSTAVSSTAGSSENVGFLKIPQR